MQIGAPNRCSPRLLYQISSELIQESNFAITPNVNSFSLDLRIRDQIYTISYYFSLLRIDGNKFFLLLG
jgi:hypothetical protein